MKLILNVISSLIFSLLISSTALSQTAISANDSLIVKEYYKPYKFHIGAFGGALLNLHLVDFSALPGIPSCCPQYHSGFSIKSSFGTLFDYSFDESNNWYLELRAAYSDIGSKLVTSEKEIVYKDPNSSIMGLIEHSIETNLDFVSIDPMIRWNIVEGMSWHFGGTFGIMINSGFYQKEYLVEPKNQVFENDQRTRMTYDGEIINIRKFHFGITTGLSYDLPLTQKGVWIAAPEIFLTYRPANLIDEKKWITSSVRVGLAVKYESERRVKSTEYIPIPIPEKDSRQLTDTLVAQDVPVRKEPVIKELSIVLLDFEGNPLKEPKLKVKNIISSKQYPLINYIFFDSLSSDIPNRYKMLSKSGAEGFDLNSLEGLETIPLNREILNIIGKRLRNNPEVRLKITGCNSNYGGENNNIELSRRRAEAVKDYLVSVWGINPASLSISARNLPLLPSNTETEVGREENMRVEITSEDSGLFYPLFFSDTSRSMTASTIRFKVDVETESGIKAWKIIVKQGGRILKEEIGEGSISKTIDLKLDSRFVNNTKSNEPIEYSFQVTDTNGLKSNVEIIETAVDQKFEQESTIEIFSLLLFGFDRFQIKPEHVPLIKYIRSRVKPDSKVRIIGYADESGDFEHNLDLSERRARETALQLNVDFDEVKGVGNVVYLYEDNLPLGRFLSRTVQIIIETPKENDQKKE